jgi:hypothetical protein
MTEHLAKRFIDLRGQGLAAKSLTILRFDHVKRGFDIRPLVVVSQEFFAVREQKKTEIFGWYASTALAQWEAASQDMDEENWLVQVRTSQRAGFDTLTAR